MKLNDLEVPVTTACRAALDVATAYCSPALLNHEVLARYPRLGLAEEFIASFEDQATRKPLCLAAQFVRNGLAARLAANPLEHEARHDQSEALG
jgi:hypothetical protein